MGCVRCSYDMHCINIFLRNWLELNNGNILFTISIVICGNGRMHLTIMAKKSPKCSAFFFFVKSKNALLVKNLKYATSSTIRRCAKGKTGTWFFQGKNTADPHVLCVDT